MHVKSTPYLDPRPYYRPVCVCVSLFRCYPIRQRYTVMSRIQHTRSLAVIILLIHDLPNESTLFDRVPEYHLLTYMGAQYWEYVNCISGLT